MTNNQSSTYDDIRQPTAPEQFIANFFDKQIIMYENEYKIENLKRDTKQFRVADFYLPYLKVYVEYFGLYNKSKEERIRYQEKVNVYLKNDIPTVFIYPEELGYLDYAFHTKIIKIFKLKKFKGKFRKQLWKYRRNRFWTESNKNGILWFSIGLFILMVIRYELNSVDIELLRWFIDLGYIILITGIVKTIRDIRRFFWLDK